MSQLKCQLLFQILITSMLLCIHNYVEKRISISNQKQYNYNAGIKTVGIISSFYSVSDKMHRIKLCKDCQHIVQRLNPYQEFSSNKEETEKNFENLERSHCPQKKYSARQENFTQVGKKEAKRNTTLTDPVPTLRHVFVKVLIFII